MDNAWGEKNKKLVEYLKDLISQITRGSIWLTNEASIL